MVRRIVPVALTLLLACAGAPTPPPAEPTVEVEPAVRADGRLPTNATPLRQSLVLDLDPARDDFAGSTTIEIRIARPTRFVVLHASGLTIDRAEILSGGRTESPRVTARASKGSPVPDELVLESPRPLGAGTATLRLSFRGRYQSDLEGLYAVREGDARYVVSQFEAVEARRAFPCFDEPSAKIPFEVTIRAPKGLGAFANAPELRAESAGELVAHVFAPTLALPTYLVAVAVGPFDVVDGGLVGRAGNVPLRALVPRGRAKEASKAIEQARALVPILEEAFRLAFPYPKLDLVAVPDFGAGAMENAGLITFREEILLLDAEEATTRAVRHQAAVIAHELAHHWFGDLVTPKWWDDLWLNEGFAMWMEARALDVMRPEWHAGIEATDRALSVMDLDELTSARSVRKPVETASQIAEAFDGIAYDKGAAVLHTLEAAAGEDAFARGVQRFLAAHAHGNADAAALLRELDAASGRDLTTMASRLLDQPGVPLVTVSPQCDPKRRWHAEVGVQPFGAIGAPITDDDPRGWDLAVCSRTSNDALARGACEALVQGAPVMLGGRGACPKWIFPNATHAYYRYRVPEAQLVLATAALAPHDARAALSLMANAWANVRAGSMGVSAFFELLTKLDGVHEPHVVAREVAVLTQVEHTLVSVEARPAFQAYAKARLRPHLDAPKSAGETDDDVTSRRESALRGLADLAGDADVLAAAEAEARSWLADRRSVARASALTSLELSSRRGTSDQLAALRASLASSTDTEERTALLKAIGGFDDERLARAALDLTLTPEVRRQDVRYIVLTALSRKPTARVATAWIREHWDALREKLPGGLIDRLVVAAGTACTAEEVDRDRTFFAPRAAHVPGAPRRVAEALERAGHCVALRDARAAATTEVLQGSAVPTKARVPRAR